jgi:hypothetical protein
MNPIAGSIATLANRLPEAVARNGGPAESAIGKKSLRSRSVLLVGTT